MSKLLFSSDFNSVLEDTRDRVVIVGGGAFFFYDDKPQVSKEI